LTTGICEDLSAEPAKSMMPSQLLATNSKSLYNLLSISVAYFSKRHSDTVKKLIKS